MKTFLPQLAISVSLFISCSQGLLGQTEPVNNVSIRALLCQEGINEVELFYSQKNTQEAKSSIKVGSLGFSESFSPIETVCSLAIKPATSDKPVKTIAQISGYEADQSYILLLMPSEESWSYRLIPESKWESTLLVNLTTVSLHADIGEQSFPLKPDQVKIVASPNHQEASWYAVQFFQITESGRKKTIANTRWPTEKLNRTIVYFVQNHESNRITYRAIDDFHRR